MGAVDAGVTSACINRLIPNQLKPAVGDGGILLLAGNLSIQVSFTFAYVLNIVVVR